MTKWFAWFRVEGKEPHFKVLSAIDINKAEMMANELADRNKVELIGVIVASEDFN